MARSFGWRPDPPDTRDFKLSSLATVATPPESASMREFAVPVDRFDQGNASSCVGHAVAGGIFACHARVEGSREGVELASRLFLYWNSRHYHDATSRDDGTFLRTAMRSVDKLGFCPERVLPYKAEDWSKKPGFDAYHAASSQRMPIGYFRIDTHGPARIADVKRAIASGFPVLFGTPVTHAFARADTSDYFEPPEDWTDIAGGHAMHALEYDADGVRGPQSWGPDYAVDGWFALSWSYIAWGATQDLWAIQAAPLFPKLAP